MVMTYDSVNVHFIKFCILYRFWHLIDGRALLNIRSRDITDGVMFINVFSDNHGHSLSKTGMSFFNLNNFHTISIYIKLNNLIIQDITGCDSSSSSSFLMSMNIEYMTKGTNWQKLGLRNKLGAVWPHLFIPR